MMNRCRMLFLLGLLLAGDAGAQQQASALFQFRISNPGARSLGFAGAFAGLADDASAAYANPAGLVQLLRPEMSAEVRVTGFKTREDSDLDFSGVGFASFVYPLKRFSFAAYRAEIVNVAAGTIAVENVGLAAAYRATEDLSFGVSLARFDGDFAAVSTLQLPDSAAAEVPVLLTSAVDATDLGFNAGFLWHLPRRFSLGGFFRRGPSFALTATLFAPETPPVTDPRVPFDLADVFGLGVAYRSRNGALTASFEWDRLQSASALEDGDELHLGVELALIRTSPVFALRLGVWKDSDRMVRRSGEAPIVRLLLPVGDGETHVAAGLGLAMKHLKLDLGFDHSELVDTGSFSIVYSF